MNEQKNLTVINDQNQLDKIVSFTNKTSDSWGFSPELTGEINLMLEELFINTISYGYTDTAVHEIKISFKYENRLFTIEFSDDGLESNPLTTPEADTSLDIMDRKIGGLGMYLIKKLSDTVEYKYENGRNTLIIIKTITVN